MQEGVTQLCFLRRVPVCAVIWYRITEQCLTIHQTDRHTDRETEECVLTQGPAVDCTHTHTCRSSCGFGSLFASILPLAKAAASHTIWKLPYQLFIKLHISPVYFKEKRGKKARVITCVIISLYLLFTIEVFFFFVILKKHLLLVQWL